jgi:hypothetical protein
MIRSTGSTQLACVAVVVAWSADARAADGPAGSGDPVTECIAASERGQSERDAGTYRRARQDFLVCAGDACPLVVAKSCAGWIRELDQTAPTVVLGAHDERGHDLDDVTVTFDGAPFASRLDGRPTEVDAGPHVLRFERAGSVPVEERVVLRAGEKARVVTVTLRSTVAETAVPDVEAEAPAPPPEEPALSARHVTAAALMLGALGASGAGVYFLAQAGSESRSASSQRGSSPANACAGSGSSFCGTLAQTVDQQHTDINVATSVFLGAGVLALGSVAAWWLWPRPTRSPAAAGIAPVPGGAVLFLEARLP